MLQFRRTTITKVPPFAFEYLGKSFGRIGFRARCRVASEAIKRLGQGLSIVDQLRGTLATTPRVEAVQLGIRIRFTSTGMARNACLGCNNCSVDI
jgi:hypothetical protein